MINAVVFDMDGVLCHYRIERRLALLASWSGQSPDAIHAAIAHSFVSAFRLVMAGAAALALAASIAGALLRQAPARVS